MTSVAPYYCPRCDTYDHTTPESCCRCQGEGITVDGYTCSCPTGIAISTLDARRYHEVRKLPAHAVLSVAAMEESGVEPAERLRER